PGDDLRYVDWRMYARSDRHYVKQFEEETNLRAYLLVDASASMAWSSSPGALPPKLWYAKQLSACLALLLPRLGAALGLIGFDGKIRAAMGPLGGCRPWHDLLRALAPLEATGRTEAANALRDIAGRLPRRGLVVLCSALLVDPEST